MLHRIQMLTNCSSIINNSTMKCTSIKNDFALAIRTVSIPGNSY